VFDGGIGRIPRDQSQTRKTPRWMDGTDVAAFDSRPTTSRLTWSMSGFAFQFPGCLGRNAVESSLLQSTLGEHSVAFAAQDD
jgi:hypothetical protein